MKENNTADPPSLIPYLAPHTQGLRLKLKIDAGRDSKGNDSIPLMPIASSGPFANLLEATVCGADDVPLSDLFLLVQPDRYGQVSELDAVNNLQVEVLWQQAIARSTAMSDHYRSSTLVAKKDEQGRPMAFRPLYLCRYLMRYGHSLCPHCGEALALCRDEQQLHAAGLHGFGDSLERYLYCPSCKGGTETGVFYSLEPADGSAAHVQSNEQLIEDFSRLLSRGDLADELPCVGCSEATQCFGPETLVRQRMVPLFFYPFHAIAQPVPTINSLDFLSLLSGAPVATVAGSLFRKSKTARLERLKRLEQKAEADNGLMFTDDPRRFLEVLYLKLTFLRELALVIGEKRPGTSEPEASLSLEAIWVDLPSSSIRLPLLWNFSTRLVDTVGRPRQAMASPSIKHLHLRQFLGKAWCYTLLVNANQTLDTVLRVVEQYTSNSKGSNGKISDPKADIDPVFSPLNLLWESPEWQLQEHWHTIWRQVLSLGLSLFDADARKDDEVAGEVFLSQLDSIRNDVHQALFLQTSDPEETVQPAREAPEKPPTRAGAETDTAADVAIASILRDILNQWPGPDSHTSAVEGETPEGVPEKPTPQVNEDGDFEETIILRPSAVDKVEKAASDDLEETVMLQDQQSSGDSQRWQDDMESTIVMSPQPGPAADATDLDDELEKTIVMQPSQAPPKETEDLDKTVLIQTSASTQEASNNRPQAPGTGKKPHEDDLAETVIINPDKLKERKPR